MNDNKNTDTKRRKTYEKPGIISEKVFETMALSCGSVGFACINVPPKS